MLLKQTEKKSSTKRSKPQRIRERRGGRSCPIWVFSYAEAQKKFSPFFTNRHLMLQFDASFKSLFVKTMTLVVIA